MSGKIELRAGTPFPLPTCASGWSISAGAVELYLVTDQRRRLISALAKGDVIQASSDPAFRLSLIAVEDTQLTETAPGNTGKWQEELIEFDRRFAQEDEARDASVRNRLQETGLKARAQGSATALMQIAAHFGIEAQLQDEEQDWSATPSVVRLAGLRAARIILEDGWWRDDTGPILVRHSADKQHVESMIWEKGTYRGVDGPAQPGLYDPIAWRIYGPLTDNIGSFFGMAGSVLKGLRRESAWILGAAFGSALLGLTGPLASGWIFDDIVPAGEAGLLISAGIALFAAALVTAILSTVRTFAVARVAGRGQTNMAAAVADKVLRLPARFFKAVSAGDFNQRIQALESIRALVTSVILDAGLTLVFALIYLLLLFVYDARMALAGLALTLIYAVAVFISRIRQTAPLREAAERDGKLAGLTFEILEGLPKLRSAAAEGRMLDRWNTAYVRERTAAAKGQRVGNRFAAFAEAWRIVTLIGLFACAALLATAQVPPGQFIAFLAAFAVFQASFSGFCEAVMAIQTAQPQFERAEMILAAEPEATAGRADPGKLTGDIQASGLSFGYDHAMAPLIDGLSFSVKSGEHLAIVGGSGSGKSTVLRLLLGFEKPLTGSLAFDGQELASLDPSRVRSQIGVVMQSSQLFAGSIYENIRGATSATLEQCMRAAERAGLARDLDLMPMGMHTPITEGAGTLSGGQRQRILIARALAAEPRILFFDEATSALDNATQAIVSRTLDEMKATRITIAHRLTTVRNADRICVLERGKFVETGSFTELMALDGAFAALARRQLLEE